MKQKQQIRRASGVIAAAAATAIVTIYAFKSGIDVPAGNIAGAYCSLAALVAACMIIKAGDVLFYSGLVFVFMASPMGSILNLYRTFDPYDKIVHLLSGFLLSAFGMVIMQKLMKKFSGIDTAQRGELTRFAVPVVFAAFMFGSGCAGLWEIFEFAGDKLMGGQMQRGMVDTVTDMIAGNLGALTYSAFTYYNIRKGK